MPDLPFMNLNNEELQNLIHYDLNESDFNFDSSFVNSNLICRDDIFSFDNDSSLYNNINLKCDYLDDDSFNQNFDMCNKFSLIHFNIRSINANFDKLK